MLISRKRPAWRRGGLRTYLLLIALIACRGDYRTILWGLVPFLPGLVLHVWAKGCLRQNQVVSRGGPYRFVRHPFYSANFLIDEGIAIMSGWWPLMVLLPVWWLAVYLPVMAREERTLAKLFPEVYPEYQRRLPRLLPLRRPLPAEGERFSWRNPNIASDTVIPRQLRLLAYPWLFVLSQLIHAKWAVLAAVDKGYLLGLAVVPVTLYGLSRELALHLKRGRRLLPEWMCQAPFRAAFAVGFLVAVFVLRALELEAGATLKVIAGTALVLSVALYAMRARVWAEGIALAGAAVLCELPWLAAAPVLLYAALGLDQRLAGAAAPRPTEQPARLRYARAAGYLLLVAAGIAVGVAKELPAGAVLTAMRDLLPR